MGWEGCLSGLAERGVACPAPLFPRRDPGMVWAARLVVCRAGDLLRLLGTG
jgi:hypothetical protein